MSPLKREFIEVFEKTGWSQAEAARQLDVERATVNGIVTGDDNPSPTLLKLLKLMLEKRNAAAHTYVLAESASDAGVIEELWKRRAIRAERSLHEIKMDLRRILDRDLPGEPAEKKPSLSGAEKVASAGDVSAELAAGESKASPPSPEAGGTSVRKGGPGRGIDKRSGRRRAPQGEAPK